MKLSTPLWYHPSTVIMLDDEPDSLERFQKNIGSAFTPLIQTDPNETLMYLKKWSYKKNELAKTTLAQDVSALPSKEIEAYEVNITQLRNKLIDDSRFKRTLVAIIDRHMSLTDGLDLCETIKEELQLPVKLILLTGATSTTEAVDAFNKGKIDAYIAKRPNPTLMLEEINHHLKRLAWNQFQELTNDTLGSLVDQFKHLSDADFCEIFTEIRQKESIIEFYPLNSCENFLLFDNQGNAKLLSIYGDDDFETAIEVATDSEAPKSVIQRLEKREAYPVSQSRRLSSRLEGRSWNDAMLPVTQVKQKAFFYHLSAEPNLNQKGYSSLK